MAFDKLTVNNQVATGLAAAVGSIILWWQFLGRNKSASSIPHVKHRIPFIGSGLDFTASMVQFAFKHQKTYGNIFSTTIFGQDWYFVFDKQDIRKVLFSPEKNVSMYQAIQTVSGKFFPAWEKFSDARLKKLASRSGAGFAATPHFIHSLKPQRLRAWVPGIRELVQKDLRDLPDEGEIDLFEWCDDMVSAITARVLFGKMVTTNKEFSTKWIELCRRGNPSKAFSKDTLLEDIVDIIFRGERRVFSEARDLILPIVDEEIERCIAGEPEAEDASAVSSFVRAWYQLRLQKNPDYLRGTRERMANDMFFFTFAAVTNSFSAVGWVLFHVMRNTGGVGDRIRAELTKLDLDSLDSLPEMEKAINEVSRLYTPGNIFRVATVPFKLPSTGDVIPAGSFVAFNVAAAHRNPEAFSNPLDFDPTRFDEGRDEGTANGTFLPFGAGAHPCVGRRFAILEIALFCSEALQQFDWDLVGDETREEDPFTQSIISNVPRHPKFDAAQQHSIWHAVEPVMVQYKRKTASLQEVSSKVL